MAYLPQISEADADRALRRVMFAANLKPGGEPPASIETRRSLLEAFQHIETPVVSEHEPVPIAVDQLTRQALRVLAEDPAFGQLVPGAPSSGSASGQPPRDFAVDPIALIGTTSLALLVLSTYINLERDSDGRWTFHLRINPVSDKLKTQIIKLATSLISVLPKK
jgi:hypothetical protein